MSAHRRKLARLPCKSALAAVVCLALGGCTVGPKYHRPPVAAPPIYRGAPADSAQPTAGSLGDMAWWHVFSDPVLQDLLRRARTGNADVRIAAGRVELVQAQFRAIRAAYGPQVIAQADETQQRISPIGLPRNRTTGNPAGSANIVNMQATWEIDFWGKYRSANQAGRATLLASQAAQQAVMTTLVADVASAYFDLLALSEQRRAAQEGVAMRVNSLNLILARKDSGVASLTDVRMAETQVEQARELVTNLQQSITIREDEIRMLLGANPGDVPKDSDIWKEMVPEVGPGLPSTLIERRPDIREAEQNLIAANANIGVARAAYFPNIGLTAEGGLESTAFHNLFTGPAETWLLQPAINLPIFTAGRIRAYVQQTEAQQKISLNVYEASVHGAFRDVSDALAYRERAVQAEQEQQRLANAAKSAADLSRARFNSGVVSYLQVLETDQISLSAQINLARIRYDRLNATVQLYRALGGGWQP